MNLFVGRSNGIEIMDDLDCKGDVVNQTLRELEFINRTLGGNQITVDGVNALVDKTQQRPLVIIDLGCGGGDMLILLANHFKKKGVKAEFIGIDANPNIIDYAREHAHDPQVRFSTVNILSEEFRAQTFDIAIATLFFHHFSSGQLSVILKWLYSQVRTGIVINDLHRHPFAYYSIKLLTMIFSKSAMVKFDAPLSVLRGFSRKELVEILENAGIKNYALTWRWAFRWKIVICKV
ncbi:MAG TPA: methyltransferase domain-containing protein [Cyclobacteriaceae bacterium]|jgi:2-polyprenyl-3-methyl-5-hydroxy-6-metoxy-1,4-benzoquinol methylase|nr:methyltransferase domain-containing protein [Cyclobacteriaceae bacterium]